jgi:hypothetical protein
MGRERHREFRHSYSASLITIIVELWDEHRVGLAQQLIVDFDQGFRDKLVPISFSLKPQFVFKSGAKRRHAPQAHELKGTGIKVPEPPLAAVMRADASVVAAREAILDKQIARPRAPKQKRAIMSVVKADGTIPVTIGGKAPPISALSQRSFGLRALRRYSFCAARRRRTRACSPDIA